MTAEGTAPPSSRYNVTARYEDMKSARQAVGALERGGAGGSNISLLGRRAEQEAVVEDTRERDEQLVDEGLKSTLTGAAVGGGVGALAGLIAGAAAFGFGDMGLGVWTAVAGGTAAGGGVGFVIGAMLHMKQSEAWELSLAEDGSGEGAGPVLVGVHTEDREEFERAVRTLKATHPAELRTYDRQGEELDV